MTEIPSLSCKEDRDRPGKPNTRVQLYWNTLLRIPIQVIGLIISILVARLLDPRDFGVMGIAMMLIGYANIFTNFGLSDAVIQKGIDDEKTLNSIFTFNFTFSAILATGFFAMSGLIADFFNTPECRSAIKVLSLVFIITAFTIIPSSILRKNMDFKVLVLVELIKTILMSVITLLMAWQGYGYWALVFGQIIPLIFMSIILCIKVRYIPVFYYSHNLMREIYNFGGWNFFRVQLSFLSQHIDRFVVGKWMGPLHLGFYDKALTLGTTPYNTLVMNINAVMFSSFSNEKHNVARVKESFKKSLALVSFISLPMYFGLIVVAPYFVSTLLGTKWNPMIIPFQIILIGFIFRSFIGLVTSLNVGVGRYKNQTVRSFVAFILFAGLCFLFYDQNIVVISICFMAYSIVEMILLIDLSRKALKLTFIDLLMPFGPGLLSSLVMLFVTLASSIMLFQARTITNMFLIILTGSVTYIICILLNTSELASEFRMHVLDDVKKILLSRKVSCE